MMKATCCGDAPLSGDVETGGGGGDSHLLMQHGHLAASSAAAASLSDLLPDITESLCEMQERRELCDAILEADGCVLPVHRIVLAAYSPYFLNLFTGTDAPGTGQGQGEKVTPLSCSVHGMDSDTARAIVDYMYGKTSRINVSNVFKVIKWAEELGVLGLVETCALFLQRSLSPQLCVRALNFAMATGMTHLETASRDYLLNNFISFSPDDFAHLPWNVLADVIGEDELKVRSEEEVRRAICAWIQHDPSSRLVHLPHLLRQVRTGCDMTLTDYVTTSPDMAQLVDLWHQILSDDKQKDVCCSLPTPSVSRPRVPSTLLFAFGGWSCGIPVSYLETYDPRANRFVLQSPTMCTAPAMPRAYYGIAAIDGVIYYVGGYNGRVYLSAMSAFYPALKTWKELAPMYEKRCYLCTTVMAGHIYAMGGCDGSLPPTRLNTVEKYNPATNQWTRLASMLHRRSDAGADATSDAIYVVGGFDGFDYLSSAERYSRQTGQWTLLTCHMTSARSGLAVIILDRYLYALGGSDAIRGPPHQQQQDKDEDEDKEERKRREQQQQQQQPPRAPVGDARLNSGERYDLDLGKWTPIPSMRQRRSNFGVAVLEDWIYVIGGFDGGQTISSVEKFNPDKMVWSDVASMGIARSALRVACVSCLPNAKEYCYLADDDN